MSNTTRVIIAIIGLIGAIGVAWIQFRPPIESHEALIAGKVISNPDGRSIPQAKITIIGRTDKTLTDDDGGFRITIKNPPKDGSIRIQVSKSGYRSVDNSYTIKEDLIIPMEKLDPSPSTTISPLPDDRVVREILHRIRQIDNLPRRYPIFSDSGIQKSRDEYQSYFEIANTFVRSLRYIYYGSQGTSLLSEFNTQNLSTLFVQLNATSTQPKQLQSAIKASENLGLLLSELLTDSNSYIPEKDYDLLKSKGTISQICDGFQKLKNEIFPQFIAIQKIIAQ